MERDMEEQGHVQPSFLSSLAAHASTSADTVDSGGSGLHKRKVQSTEDPTGRHRTGRGEGQEHYSQSSKRRKQPVRQNSLQALSTSIRPPVSSSQSNGASDHRGKKWNPDKKKREDPWLQPPIENADLVTVPHRSAKNKPNFPWPAIAFRSWADMNEWGLDCEKHMSRPVKESQRVICYCGSSLTFGVVSVEKLTPFDPTQEVSASKVRAWRKI